MGGSGKHTQISYEGRGDAPRSVGPAPASARKKGGPRAACSAGSATAAGPQAAAWAARAAALRAPAALAPPPDSPRLASASAEPALLRTIRGSSRSPNRPWRYCSSIALMHSVGGQTRVVGKVLWASGGSPSLPTVPELWRYFAGSSAFSSVWTKPGGVGPICAAHTPSTTTQTRHRSLDDFNAKLFLVRRTIGTYSASCINSSNTNKHLLHVVRSGHLHNSAQAFRNHSKVLPYNDETPRQQPGSWGPRSRSRC